MSRINAWSHTDGSYNIQVRPGLGQYNWKYPPPFTREEVEDAAAAIARVLSHQVLQGESSRLIVQRAGVNFYATIMPITPEGRRVRVGKVSRDELFDIMRTLLDSLAGLTPAAESVS
jgi:hypothetical protein